MERFGVCSAREGVGSVIGIRVCRVTLVALTLFGMWGLEFTEERLDVLGFRAYLGRALGHFIFSLVRLKRILFTIFQKL